MKVQFYVQPSDTMPLNPEEEYYAFKVQLLNTKTTGLGSCEGCSESACITCTELQVIEASGAPGGNVILNNAAESNFVTWNSAGAGCAGAVPVRKRTWGMIQALYR